MNFDQLKTFFTVAKLGSFTAAAAELNVDQSNVSRKILTMEARLRTKLFIRKARGLMLTPEGQILLQETREILEKVDGLRTLLGSFSQRASGQLDVFTYVGFYDFFVLPHLHKFFEAFPDIQLEIFKNDVDQVDFSTGRTTVAITPYLKDTAGIIQEPLARTHIKLYASPEYLEKYGEPTRPEDLDQHRLIAYGPRNAIFSRMNWHLILGSLGGHLRTPFIEVNCPDSRVALAEQGCGISTIPVELSDLSQRNLVPVLPQEEGTSIDFFYSYANRSKSSLPVKTFFDFLKKNIKR